MASTNCLLKNPAMLGFVKIGKTTQDDPTICMDELCSTFVPVPMDCVVSQTQTSQITLDVDHSVQPSQYGKLLRDIYNGTYVQLDG